MTVSVTLEQAREWIGVPAALLPDDQLQVMLDGEQANQAWACRVDPALDQPALDAALLRRVARAAAVKGLPLGSTAGAGTATSIPDLDADVVRLEAPWRKFVFA